MKRVAGCCCLALLITVLPQRAMAEEDLPPIREVEIRSGGVFCVNGEPFFPLMAWLQDAENLPAVKACGMNATAGYWPGSGGTKGVAGYLTQVREAGLYGVMPFSPTLEGNGGLLGYIHGDEPDLPGQVNDAEIVPGAGLRVNRKTPLWKILDGVPHSWSVLDPLEGASLTIRLKQPVTVERLAVWLTVSSSLPLAREVSFSAGGREILRATLQPKKGRQEFELETPAAFQELTFTVHSTHPGEQEWGSISEIEGFDADGRNVLLAPPRNEPRARPETTLAEYRAIKAADPSRPVFMTLTGNFHPHFDKWSEEQRASLYPRYIEATDVVGYDIYPIYGWNKPEWIHLVHEATGLLVHHAGGRPVYAWIETSKGGQWTGPLEQQKDVAPEHIRAEVWMAVCRGATAVGYFTHVWKPSYRQFGVPDENRQALSEINQQITRLAPVILGPAPDRSISIRAATDAKLDVMAREHDGRLYLFAVNYDERRLTAEATMEVDGLPGATTVEVVDEGRTIRSQEGSFTDVFEPLAVHIYRIDPGRGE